MGSKKECYKITSVYFIWITRASRAKIRVQFFLPAYNRLAFLSLSRPDKLDPCHFTGIDRFGTFLQKATNNRGCVTDNVCAAMVPERFMVLLVVRCQFWESCLYQLQLHFCDRNCNASFRNSKMGNGCSFYVSCAYWMEFAFYYSVLHRNIAPQRARCLETGIHQSVCGNR